MVEIKLREMIPVGLDLKAIFPLWEQPLRFLRAPASHRVDHLCLDTLWVPAR